METKFERTELEKCIFRIFHTDDGQFLLDELFKRYVTVDIVQNDGVVPSSIREGKSQLIRYLKNTYKSQIDE